MWALNCFMGIVPETGIKIKMLRKVAIKYFDVNSCCWFSGASGVN